MGGRYAAYKCCGATTYPYYYAEGSDVVCTNDAGTSNLATGC
jgi:hypothetical protein